MVHLHAIKWKTPQGVFSLLSPYNGSVRVGFIPGGAEASFAPHKSYPLFRNPPSFEVPGAVNPFHPLPSPISVFRR